MKRRILAWTLAVALVLCLLPAGALPAFAAEGLPELTNLKYNEGVISWDPYPGASHYYYVVGDYLYTGWTSDGKSELDIMQRLKNSYAPSDTYAVRIYANDDDYNEIACSEITCIYYGLERHPAPANLRWDGYTARWDPVEGAGNGYVIYVFRSDTDSYVYSTQTNETYFNAANYLHYQDWNYCFMVKVCGSESGAESEYAKCPTSIPGRFTLGDMTLSLNGDRLSWPPYVDTEGNEAYRYYICEGYSNPQNLGYYFYGTGVNLRKLLELKDAPGGTYEYSLVAECRSGLEVSNESDTVTYEYTPQTRTVATMTQYESRGGSLSGLCLYGLQISNYRNYSCTVGAEIPVLVIPWEHYVANKLLVCYGGEEHEGGELTRQANGTYIGSFTVPNEDFTLTVEMDYDYVDLHSASGTFSTAPGQKMNNIEIFTDENTNAYLEMTFNSNNQICYSEFLLPGDEIRQIVQFRTRESYQRFAEDVTAEINGQSAEVLHLTEDRRYLYCAYDFTVPDESFTLEYSTSWDPIPNLSVSDSGVITWDPYPGTAMYYVGGSSFFSSDGLTECSFDLAERLRDNRAPSGWYAIDVEAVTEEWGVLAYSWIAWYYDGAEQLAAPTNLRWDGNTARWDTVEGAASYHVRIIEYPDSTYETERYTTTNSYDFSDYLQEKNKQYVFRVNATPEDDRASSPWSPISEPRQGRFIRGPLNVTLDGDVLSWEEYIDTEGNPAAKYRLYEYEGPSYLSYDTFIGTSVNLREVLELINADDGEYKFDLTAYAKDSSTVSQESDQVTYAYTANPRTTVKLDGYQCELGYYMDMARINGMTLPKYDSLTVTAGKLYSLTLRPEEHYVLEDVAIRYGEEDHYDAINLERKSDGTYTCRFRAPDQDFKLFFKTQWDWVDLNEAQITFSEAPGTRMDYYYMNEPEWTCCAYMRDTISSDKESVGGAYFLLPGQRWVVTLQVKPKEDWQRFSENPTITVNGKEAEIIKRSEDGREVYVRYEFEVADAAAVELEPYDEGYPALENVKVSADGVVTWDPFPGADHYYVYSDDRYDSTHLDTCSFDLRAALEDRNAPSGWVKFLVSAEDDSNSDLAYGEVAWYYSGAEQIAAPTNLRWDGYTAQWDPVEGAAGYILQAVILGEESIALTRDTYDTSLDLSNTVFKQESVYAFRVYAYGDDAARSDWSLLSEGKRGRFRYEDITVSLDGDVLSWPEYIDTEGNPAYYYYIYQYGNPEVFNATYYGTTLNLRQALEMENAPDGDYTFMVYAEEIGGRQISHFSNQVVYHYEDQPRTTVNAKLNRDWNSEVLINGISAYDGEIYALTVGKETTLVLRPDDRYRAKEAYLLFDDDERQEIPLTEDANRISTGSFTVPDKNFTLFVRSERVYEKLHSLSADFCEDPGYLLALTGITPEGVNDWRAQVSGLTGPHGAGNASLRPGAEYEADIDFYIESDVYRFADDVTVKINGRTCTPESADGSHVRVKYTFTVSSELKSVIVRGVTAPALEAKPEVGQGVPGGVYYSIVNESAVSRRWYYYEDGWKWMTEDEEFRPDISYILQLEYATEEGCTWADDLKVQVEDVDPARIESISVLPSGEPEGSNRTVEIHFKPLSAPKPLESAGCTIEPPVEGAHPDMAPMVLDTEKYTVTLTGWYWNMQPGVKMTSASTFEAGGTYCLRVWFEPKEGYYFTEDTVFTVNGKPFDSRYGFELGQVQIDLIAEANVPDVPIESGPFVDVPADKFYYDAVNWAVEHDPVITNGIDATHFGPDNACTRGHVVTFLWRAAGCPEPSEAESPFTDLKPGAFYEKAVAWAVEQGITNGTSATTFSPDAACNRGQIVTFLWRYKGGAEPAGTADVFTDLKPGAFYEKAVAWAVENNITNGMTPTTFGPDNTCTRGQVVTFLYRADKA